MKEKLELFKKYGATGVLALWLGLTTNRVASLENKLENCYREQILKQGNKKVETSFNIRQLAILTDKLKIKKV